MYQLLGGVEIEAYSLPPFTPASSDLMTIRLERGICFHPVTKGEGLSPSRESSCHGSIEPSDPSLP
jgi:hypothetical protein